MESSLHTPERWDAASFGYAGLVRERFGGGAIRLSNAATVGSGVRG